MGSAINGVKWTSLSAVVNACAKLGQISILTRFLRKEDIYGYGYFICSTP